MKYSSHSTVLIMMSYISSHMSSLLTQTVNELFMFTYLHVLVFKNPNKCKIVNIKRKYACSVFVLHSEHP